jgi:NodT family efflux transporter outer membrane factor (OMF) lipoprotein
LRSHIIYFLCLIGLTGCVNYANIHGDAKPLDDTMLNTSYSDTGRTKLSSAATGDWWKIYKDPQLNKLIATALTDSPSLQIAQSRLATARHIAEEAGASLWPDVSAYGQIQREHITENTYFPPPFGGNNYTETNFGLNFNYEFDFWGKNHSIIAARTSDARAAQAEVAQARLILAAAITSSYFQLQYEQRALAINIAIVKQRQELLKIIKVRATHGVVSDIPVTTANADLQSTRMNITNLQEQIKLTSHELAALMGKNPFTTDIHTEKFAYNKNILRLPKVLPANLLARRPDIIASRWRMESAASLVNASKARFYPNINLVGLLSYQSFILQKTFNSSSRDSYVGAAIDLPIFDAGRRRANLRTQYAEYDTAVAQYNETILTALRDVADQISTLHALAAKEIDQNNALSATQKNYNLTRARFHNGIVDYADVLESEGSLLTEEYNQTELQAQHLKTTVAMIKALGGNYLSIEG